MILNFKDINKRYCKKTKLTKLQLFKISCKSFSNNFQISKIKLNILMDIKNGNINIFKKI